MMNKLMLSLAILLSLPLAAAQPKGQRQDYKCLVETTRAAQEIIRVSWDPAKAELYQRQMPGMKLERIGNRGKRHYVREVFECVPREQAFRSDSGRQLDDSEAGLG
ncbi:TapY2 family type IVa secretion system protein [Shewanella algae]|uniref:TapY2 family type IVa secretion system protein n=1 Tax=Shewanella TaxID=22 RepID=UPI0011827D36|nr:TapY2 family type IVa secretion system protein [Shewanella algae]MBO2551663.1 TapY2 family type IVa secretion system protein [Shewanella algae]MBO2678527.1 TapY2 family type IVa secretion system protein [Shewanella algae]QWL08741.1 TapY2 family type IVa secretion system protein [Shewanella algae]